MTCQIKVLVIDQNGNDTPASSIYQCQGDQPTVQDSINARDCGVGRLEWLGIRVSEVICHRDEIKIWRA